MPEAKGTKAEGINNARAKLTDAEVYEIRDRRNRGEKVADLAEAFGVHKGTISRVARKLNWIHLD